MHIMQWLRRLPVPRTSAHPPGPLPPYAPLLEHIAAFALGNAARGRALAAHALSESATENDAVRRLLDMLPPRSAAWPASTRTSTDATSMTERVLVIARRWQPWNRCVVGLYVLGNREGDDLAQLSGTSRAAVEVAECLLVIAAALGLLPKAEPSAACDIDATSLLDADHPERGRAIRTHALGCARCRTRVEAIQQVVRFLRTAIEQHFAVPSDMPAAVSRSFPWTNTTRIMALVAVIAALLIGVTGQAAPSSRQSMPSLTADALLDRALARFDAPETAGVLHERYQTFTGLPTEIERYVDGQNDQLRLTVTRTKAKQPLLDLVVAEQRLRYTLWDDGEPTTIAVDNPRVRELLPLLRRLPEGGAVRSFPAVHSGTDIDFLNTARQVGATLLGSTTFDNRPVYLLSYREPEQAAQMVLTVDAATYALLRASNSGTGSHGRTEVLWQAAMIEELADVPPEIFDTTATSYEHILPNPRHLTFGPFSNIRLGDVSSVYGFMPVPTTVPNSTTASYLREDHRIGVMQLYEGPHSTVAMITSAPPLPSISLRRLQFRTGETYWDVISDEDDATHIEFIRNTDPTHRSHLYVWHATMNAAERRAWAESIITSIHWIPNGDGDDLGQRFEDVQATPSP